MERLLWRAPVPLSFMHGFVIGSWAGSLFVIALAIWLRSDARLLAPMALCVLCPIAAGILERFYE